MFVIVGVNEFVTVIVLVKYTDFEEYVTADLFSTPLIGIFKINGEHKLTLKIFNISMEKRYFFSNDILENFSSSFVIVMLVLTRTQIIQMNCKNELFCILESALPFSGSCYNVLNF